MQLEEGKFYRTRDGRKVGPAHCDPDHYSIAFPWIVPASDGTTEEDRSHFAYKPTGSWLSEFGNKHDIVAEWTDEAAPASRRVKLSDVEAIDAFRVHREALRNLRGAVVGREMQVGYNGTYTVRINADRATRILDDLIAETETALRARGVEIDQ